MLKLKGSAWNVSVSLAAPWTVGGENTIDYTNSVTATSFTFHDEEHTTYPSSHVTINHNNWDITFDQIASSVFYLSFTISSPQGATWSVQKEDPDNYFTLLAIDDGAPVAPTGTVDATKTITLQIRPNTANIPNSRSEAYTMVLHTYVEVGDNAYNIDSETQLFNVYNKLAGFIIPANQ